LRLPPQVLMFSETGRCYILKAFQIPKNTRTSMGTPLVQLGVMDKILNVTTLDPQTVGEDDSLVFVTSQVGGGGRRASFGTLRASWVRRERERRGRSGRCCCCCCPQRERAEWESSRG
jgi:hypothetical protein